MAIPTNLSRVLHANRSIPALRGTPAKCLGILVARAIVQGDFDMARKLAALLHMGWSVAEARAIAGASRFATTVYGAPRFEVFS